MDRKWTGRGNEEERMFTGRGQEAAAYSSTSSYTKRVGEQWQKRCEGISHVVIHKYERFAVEEE